MWSSAWPAFAAIAIVSAGLIAASSYKLWSAGMLAFADLTAFPDRPGPFFHAFQDAWSTRGLGGPFPAGPGVLIEAVFVLLAGGHGHVAQLLVLAAWIPVAFGGIAYLCRKSLGLPWTVALVGGVVYVTTPVAIGLVVAGASGVLWAYAVMPFVLAAAERVRMEGFRAVGWFAAAVALLATCVPELLVFGGLIAFVWIAVGPGRGRVLPAMAVALAIATIAALPGLAGRAQTPLSTRLTDKALTDYSYTYAKASPPALLRLAGNQGDPMDRLGYDGTAAWTYAGFLPFALFVAGLFGRNRDKLPLRLTLLGASALCGLLALKVLAERRESFLASIPGSFAFRNPEKLMILLASALVGGAMYGLAVLLRLGRGRRLLTAAGLFGAMAIYLVLYARPAFNGDWGVQRVRGNAYVADRALLAAARYLHRTDPGLPGKWRVAWVPFSASDVVSLQWILPQWANEPVLENTDPDVEDATISLQNSLALGDMRTFHSIADRASVKYVVLHTGTGHRVLRAIRTDPKLRRVHAGHGFVIWRNTAALPRIRPFSGLTAVMPATGLHLPQFESRPIVWLRPATLSPGSRWTVFPRSAFEWVGTAIRVRASSSSFWPVLENRVRVYGNTSYVIAGLVRTRHAVAAHVKVVWYRHQTDDESAALREDIAAQPLTGTHRWTWVVGVFKSPANARFGELTFLAGRRQLGRTEPAVSWIKNLQMATFYRGDPAPTGAAVVPALWNIEPEGNELADRASLAHVSIKGVTPGVAIVNPGAGTKSLVLTPLVRRAPRVSIVAQAGVALQPRSGVWRKNLDSVELAGLRGEATVSLGFVPRRRYVVSVVGCRLTSQSLRIITPVGTLTPAVSLGPRCGGIRTSSPIPLGGRTVVRLSLTRGASIQRVAARSVPTRRAGVVTTERPRISSPDSASPTVRDFSSHGLTFADAFDPGWETTGSTGQHFRTLLGFNAFVLDQPSELRGLGYIPQRTRDLLLYLSLVAWLAIAVSIAFGIRPHKALRARLATRTPPIPPEAEPGASMGRNRQPTPSPIPFVFRESTIKDPKPAARPHESIVEATDASRRRIEQSGAELASEIASLRAMTAEMRESMRTLLRVNLNVWDEEPQTEQKRSLPDDGEGGMHGPNPRPRENDEE
jgi:hypothetical protein